MAEATGRFDLRAGCTALRLEHDDKGRATGVVYAAADGTQHFQKASLVAVACNAIETPRLLVTNNSMEAVIDRHRPHLPAGRLGQPVEIARTAAAPTK